MASEKETWKHIPQIRSHGQVEQKLDKCVQKLRRKILLDGRNRRAGGEEDSNGLGKRVPSFYTSPSLVNMSGLGVGDQLVLTSGMKKGHRELNKSESSFGVEGAPTMDSHDSEGSYMSQNGGQQVRNGEKRRDDRRAEHNSIRWQHHHLS